MDSSTLVELSVAAIDTVVNVVDNEGREDKSLQKSISIKLAKTAPVSARASLLDGPSGPKIAPLFGEMTKVYKRVFVLN